MARELERAVSKVDATNTKCGTQVLEDSRSLGFFLWMQAFWDVCCAELRVDLLTCMR